jgi:Na+/H+-dicarboxylate symporter
MQFFYYGVLWTLLAIAAGLLLGKALRSREEIPQNYLDNEQEEAIRRKHDPSDT